MSSRLLGRLVHTVAPPGSSASHARAVASLTNTFARHTHAHSANPGRLPFHPSRGVAGWTSQVGGRAGFQSPFRSQPITTTAAMASTHSIPIPASDVKTTLLVITSKEHLAGAQLAKLTSTQEVLPLDKFNIHVGCSLEDFPEEVLNGGSKTADDNTTTTHPVALLWWFGDGKTMGDVLRKPVAKNIAWIHSASAGVEHLLKDTAITQSHVPLTNAKGAFSASLGEWAIFSFLWFNKKVHAMRISQSKNEWMRAPVGMLSGKTVTIVGYGDIGRAVAVRAKALGMHVTGMRRDPSKSSEDVNSRLITDCLELNPQELKRQVGNSDFVLVSLPHTKSTENLFSRDVFAAMKPTAVFVNVGRGATVDEEALIDTLKNKNIAGAALDVTKTEPLPKESELYRLENCLLSFHTADLTHDYFDLTLTVFKQHINAYLGEAVELSSSLDSLSAPMWNLVDKHAGY